MFFYAPVLSLDVMDISGEQQRDLTHNIVKARLDPSGKVIQNSANAALRNELDVMNEGKQDNYCGSCYGGIPPSGGCCNTCEEVRQAYVSKGWSFNNPDSIEQVRCIVASACLCPAHLFWFSVCENTGQINSRNSQWKDATSPAVCVSIKLLETFICRPVAPSRPTS